MTRISRMLLALPIVLALMLPAMPAVAANPGASSYNQPVPQPSQPAPKPSSGTGPSKETSKPRTTTSAPAGKTTTPTSSSTPSSPSSSGHSTLPFTGLDLRWIIGAGVLLMGAGLSIRMMQRRQRQDLGR